MKSRSLRESTGPLAGLVSMFMFALLAAFAILSLLVVVVGAKVYRTVDGASAFNYDERTALSYLAGKVRAGDGEGMIFVLDQPEVGSVLTIESVYGGKPFRTYIYYADGALREYFSAASRAFSPGSGDPIAQAQDFSIQLAGNLLTLTVTDTSGRENTLRLCLTAGTGGGL